MKHAVITNTPEEYTDRTVVEVPLDAERSLFLLEEDYSQQQLTQFKEVKAGWLFRCKGSRYFVADSDSGEDAYGYYCHYFEPVEENAVFEDGQLVGFYLCPQGIQYSGLSRSSFSVDRWGYPGYDIFKHVSYGNSAHVYLFNDEASLKSGEWTLMKKEPEAEYRGYLDF